jgi:hypothetical protein
MQDIKKGWRVFALAMALISILVGTAAAQPTTGSVVGVVADETGGVLPGAIVVAVHEPSGSKYDAVSRADGRFAIQGMRVGGPYVVTISMNGFQTSVTRNVTVSLGVTTDLPVRLKTAALSESVTVTAESTPVFSSERTGAATAVSRDNIATLPTLGDRIDSFTKLSPQSSGRDLSFGGSDARLNNITIDGAYFNNSFGLGAAPGDRTGVAPISMAAVEEMSVNVAPFDVTQGHFVGASVNSVTRSGTNSLRGSAYWWYRNESMVGKKAGAVAFNPGTFKFHKYGAWASGPVIKNKLFFFLSYESDALVSPGTTFKANTGGQTVGGNTTRVLASDLDALSAFLSSNFKYDTGPYQDYNKETPSKRYLGKLDYNLNDRNHLSFRFSRLDSVTDVLLSNSSSAGFGNRNGTTLGLNFASSNYGILENNRSAVAEWNGPFGSIIANKLTVQYNKSNESREYKGALFPMVDILDAGAVYTTFGFEPFTPNNELRYKSFAATDNYTMFRGNHTVTVGATAEKYNSENVFYQQSQGIYVYNSLADFYTDARGYLANPARTTSPVTLRSFQVQYMNIPGLSKPLQPLEVWYSGIYAMDQWQVSKNLKVGAGLRIERSSFAATGYDNPRADAMTFMDENGQPVKYQTGKLPDPSLQWNPRFGFNWDVTGDHVTQVRGSSGLFSGPPLYVWISNQVGNTGVLTGSISSTNTTAFPFNPDPNAYHPSNVTGAPAASYALAVTDNNFKFPQVWRTNFAVDRKLPWNMVATAEVLYNRDVNGMYYINANQTAPNSAFTGADSRVRWTTSSCNFNAPATPTNCANRINPNVSNNVVLKNQNVGRAWHTSIALEKQFKGGFIKTAYSYGETKNTVDPGSIASGSWQQNQISGNPNNPGLGFSQYSPGSRVFVAGSFSKEYKKMGRTTLGFFWQATQGNGSYTVSGDLNNDSGFSNDLIYIQKNPSETTFVNQTVGGVLYTAAQQSAAWEAYIAQDKYLSKHRGEYAVRNAVFMPMLKNMDVSLTQDLFRDIKGKRNGLQVRLDVFNFGNLINHNWGLGTRFVSSQPLILASSAQGGPVSPTGAPQYTMRVLNGALINHTFDPTAGTNDVYRLQIQLRYNFN